MNPLLEQFLQEARENLKFIEEHLEELEGGDAELINSIFRAAHTLKGGSGIVSFDSVKTVTHSAEDLLDMLRSGKVAFQPGMVDALYDAFDEVLNLIEAAEATGDVVEGDDETIGNITAALKAQMGQDAAAEESAPWESPMQVLSNPAMAVEAIGGKWLAEFHGLLPFRQPPVTEADFDEPRLYAVVFDVDEECMVFGNDPLYALSLLEEKALAISCGLSADQAQSVLSPEANEEGLKLFTQITAVVHGRYSDIEDALYNFIDDLLFLPLDADVLLGVDGVPQEISFVKDVVKSVREKIAAGDGAGVRSVIADSMGLMNEEALQARLLGRIMDLAEHLAPEELAKLEGALQAAEKGEPYLPGGEPVTLAAPEPEPEEEPAAEKPAPSGFTPDPKIVAAILDQQIYQLEKFGQPETAAQAAKVLAKAAKALALPFDDTLRDPGALKEWAMGVKGDAPAAQAPKAAPAPAPEARPAQPARNERPEPKKDVIGKVVKIDQESIDHLMSIVGELLVAKNSLPYLAESVLGMNGEESKRAILEKHSFINRLTNQLQDLIMSMRMLPISYVFDRYPKLVRDISKKLDKKVKLVQEGGETKLDKNMIEMLADPLIHIVRNSLDHGVESPEVRKEAGKQETGQVLMKAYPQSDKVVIEVHDDGKGIDAERVARKVLEKGLLPLEKIEAMSDQEKTELIMLPGLSTAEEISEYSGRGVGMDVVRKSVESFGGSIQITSTMGVGTKIKLSIPVSLAVTTLLHVMMDGLNYGFPMDSVNETVKIDREEITYLHNEPFVCIRGQVIPLLFLEGILNMESLKGKPLSIVVLDVKGNQLAVVVNELIGQLDVVQKPMEGIFENHQLLSGTALLGNGQIIMTVDPLGLAALSDEIKTPRVAV